MHHGSKVSWGGRKDGVAVLPPWCRVALSVGLNFGLEALSVDQRDGMRGAERKHHSRRNGGWRREGAHARACRPLVSKRIHR
jgi:hypothetical protein